MLSVARAEERAVMSSGIHRSVLVKETLCGLAPQTGATLVDGTLGLGGHAEALLDQIGPHGRLYGIDRDPAALEHSRLRLARFGKSFTAIQGDHNDLVPLLTERGVHAVDGILLDLGVSSLQLDDPERGFAFRLDGPLDMRMDATGGDTAAGLLASCSEEELRRILWSFGEERRAAAIARELVRCRTIRPLSRTGELADVVRGVLGPRALRYRSDPATRTFQALRIAVNQEVVGLDRLIRGAVSILRNRGRLVVISYHSLEDRAVKRAYRSLAKPCTCPPRLPVCACGKQKLITTLTSKPVRPSRDEIEANNRARSARLRAAERR